MPLHFPIEAMKAIIKRRFDQNIARVKNLVTIYRNNLAGKGSGRRSHYKTDVLRSAVVLLHATMEDLLRSLAYWKLPQSGSETLNLIPLINASPATKFTLGQLAEHRGKQIDNVIADSVDAHLERSNYNNTNEVSSLLSSIGVDLSKVNSRFAQLEEIMKRRHQIVHRADIDENGGKGNHAVRSISPAAVENWIGDVEFFGNSLLGEIA